MPSILGNRSTARGHQTGRHHRVTSVGRRAPRCRIASRPGWPPSWARRPVSAASRRAACSRSDLPIGISGTPARSASSAKSGGAHTRTSTPSSRNASANPINGSTSPREPQRTTTTHAFATPKFSVLAQARILGHDRGLAARPPMRYMLKREGNYGSRLSPVERRFLEIQPVQTPTAAPRRRCARCRAPR